MWATHFLGKYDYLYDADGGILGLASGDAITGHFGVYGRCSEEFGQKRVFEVARFGSSPGQIWDKSARFLRGF